MSMETTFQKTGRLGRRLRCTTLLPLILVTCHPRIWIIACKSGSVDEAGIGLAIARAYIRPRATASDLPTVKDAGARTAQAKASRCAAHYRPDSIPAPLVRHPVTKHTERNARSAKWHQPTGTAFSPAAKIPRTARWPRRQRC